MSLLSAIFGGAVAGRHILFHILPDAPVHGFTFLGMHLYTLSLVAFVVIGLLLAVMMFLDSQFVPRLLSNRSGAEVATADSVTNGGVKLGFFARAVLGLFILIAAANLVCTVLLCGFGPCPSDPTQYLLLSWLR